MHHTQENDNVDKINDLQEVIEVYDEKKVAIEDLDQSDETLTELNIDLNKDALEAVIDIYHKKENNREVQNRTDQILEKLELEQDFVQDLESVEVIDPKHELKVEKNLEYNALEGLILVKAIRYYKVRFYLLCMNHFYNYPWSSD